MPQGQIAPEPWASAMEAVGAVSPRTGKPSMNTLAQMSGIHPTTVQRIVYKRLGVRGADVETIEAIARSLKKKPAVIAEWIGQVWEEGSPYVPPKEANILGPRARKALDELIRAVAEIQLQVPVDDDGNAA